MRIFGYLVLIALLCFGLWPYYSVYRLDDAINAPDNRELAQLVDLPALRAHYRQRLSKGADSVLPSDDSDSVFSWIRQNLDRLGDAALDQALTLDWVRETLRGAITRATGRQPPYLLAAVDYAFFERYDRFLIRLGELDENPVHVRMTLQDNRWRVTDIIP